MNRRSQQRGAVAVLVGLMLIMLCGFAGLAIDLGYGYLKRTQLQATADAEALACVVNPTALPCPTAASTDLYSVGAPYNFTSNFTMSIENPGDNTLCPASAQQISHCARVTVTDRWNTFFIGLFGFDTLSARAVAVAAKLGGGQGCVIASTYFNVSGSQGLSGANCANYLGNISINGNPPITGSANYIYNGYPASSCTTCVPAAISVNGPVPMPTLSAPVDHAAATGTVGPGFTGTVGGTLTCPSGTTCTLSPGIYNTIDCSNSNSVCILAPSGSSTTSQYTFEFNGDFKGPSNNGSITGNGVRLYFGGGATQIVSMSGGGQLTLSPPAPATGVCSGSVTPDAQIVVYAPNATTVAYNGNVSSNVTGNIYMPNAAFALGGNGGLNVNGTVVVTSYQNNGGGNSGLVVNGANSCGYTPNGSGRVVLVD